MPVTLDQDSTHVEMRVILLVSQVYLAYMLLSDGVSSTRSIRTQVRPIFSCLHLHLFENLVLVWTEDQVC